MSNLTRDIHGSSKAAEIVKRIAVSLKLYYPYNLIYMKKLRDKDPVPDGMIRARNYYSDKAGDIKEICEWLSDEKSRETFKKVIMLRQYYKKEDVPPYNYTDQYFPKDIPEFARLGENEVFVDCGAFNGDTSCDFARRVLSYDKIIAFEPDERNVSLLKKRKIQNLQIVEACCGDSEGEVSFTLDDLTTSNKIVDEGDNNSIKVPITKIDNVVGDGNVTFIKMDIEGAEMSALRGGKETICRCKPKLAICLYHSDEDMIRIPKYIHELVPEYRLYVRAHTMGIAETVLYAVAQ